MYAHCGQYIKGADAKCLSVCPCRTTQDYEVHCEQGVTATEAKCLAENLEEVGRSVQFHDSKFFKLYPSIYIAADAGRAIKADWDDRQILEAGCTDALSLGD